MVAPQGRSHAPKLPSALLGTPTATAFRLYTASMLFHSYFGGLLGANAVDAEDAALGYPGCGGVRVLCCGERTALGHGDRRPVREDVLLEQGDARDDLAPAS